MRTTKRVPHLTSDLIRTNYLNTKINNTNDTIFRGFLRRTKTFANNYGPALISWQDTVTQSEM